jgi:RHS repeat-associated protein
MLTPTELAEALFPGQMIIAADLVVTSGMSQVPDAMSAGLVEGGIVLSSGLATSGGSNSTDFLDDGLPDRTTLTVTLAVPTNQNSLLYTSAFASTESASPNPNADAARAQFGSQPEITLGQVSPSTLVFPTELRAAVVEGLTEITASFVIEDAVDGLRDSTLSLTDGGFSTARIADPAALAAELFGLIPVTSATLEGSSGDLVVVDVLSARGTPSSGTVLLASGRLTQDELGSDDIGGDGLPDSTTFTVTLPVPMVPSEPTNSLVYTTRFLTTEDLNAAPLATDMATASDGSNTFEVGSVGSSTSDQDPPVIRAFDVSAAAEITLAFTITDGNDAGLGDSAVRLSNPFFSEYEASLFSDPRPEDSQLRTGTYAYSNVLMATSGPLNSFGFMVHYNSAPRRTSGAMGPKWGHNYDWAVIEKGNGDAIVRRGDGRIESFDRDSMDESIFTASHDQIFSILSWDSLTETFTYTTKAQNAYVFDVDGRLMTITDPDGNRSTLTHDDQGRVTTVTDTRQQVAAFTYTGDLLTQVDYAGQTATLSYEGEDLHWFRDPLLQTTTFDYDTEHRIITVTDADGVQLVHNTYDGQDRVTIQKDAKDALTTTQYIGGTTVVTDREGNKVTTTFDPLDRPITVLDETGALNTYQYDEYENLSSVTDPRNAETRMEYDDRGNVVREHNPLLETTETDYDAANRPTRVRNELDLPLVFGYQPEQFSVTRYENALNVAATYQYDSRGLRTSYTDRNGNLRRYFYDLDGDLTQEVDPLAGSTLYTHDDLGRILSITDANLHTTRWALDELGRPTTVTDALGQKTTKTYDAQGRMTSETNARQLTSYLRYTPTGKISEYENPLGEITRMEYNGEDLVKSVTDAAQRATQFKYDAALRLDRVTDAAGKHVDIDYDLAGNLTRFVDTRGKTTTLTYDDLGRVLSETDPLMNTTWNGYDSRGLLDSIENARGQEIRFTYDDASRLTGIHRLDHVVGYTLDGNGNRLVTSGPGGRQTVRKFDALDRTTKVTDVNGNSVGYGYDAVGNLTSITYSDGSLVTYSYDALDRLRTVTDWDGRVTTYAYDATNNLRQARLPDGSTVLYSYDDAGQLLSIEDIAPDGQVTLRTKYELGPTGIRRSADSILPLEAPATTETRNFTINDANQLVAEGADKFMYDADGNMTQGVIGRIPVDLDYDELGRLREVGASTYEYDEDGARIRATVNHREVAYVQDTLGGIPRVLEEHDAAGNITARYVYGLGLISRHERKPGETGTSWQPSPEDPNSESDERVSVYHFDSRGSTLALTDLEGRITDRYAYDPYGLVVARDGKTRNPYTYSGRDGVIEDGNGLYFMRNRYYEPRLMRFVSRDDLSFGLLTDPQSMNRYAYARGNPVHLIDPTGASWLTAAVGFVGGALVGAAEQFVEDIIDGALVTGEFSSWEKYGAAIAGGAVEGLIIGATGNLAAGRAAKLALFGGSALVGSLTKQGINVSTGEQESISSTDLAIDVSFGVLFNSGAIYKAGAKSVKKKGARTLVRQAASRNLAKTASKSWGSKALKKMGKELLEGFAGAVYEAGLKDPRGLLTKVRTVPGFISGRAMILYYATSTQIEKVKP